MIKTANVVGGGLGGVAAAACLAKAGIEVCLFERGKELREIGAGIFLKENSIRVFEWLGCVDEVLKTGTRIEHGELLQQNGLPLSQRNLQAHRVYVVPRASLHNVLIATARKYGVSIHTDALVTGATPDGVIKLGGGRSESADLLVGADGVGSVVRDSLGLRRSVKPTGNGSWRALVPFSRFDPVDRVIEFWRGHRRVLVTPAGQGATYICASCRDDDADASAHPFNAAVWSDHFPEYADLIGRVDPETTTRRQHIDVKITAWRSGKAAILGDAVHGQPPNLGQGAGCAIANAASLVRHVRASVELRQALANWEQSERDFTEQVQTFSSLYDKVVHSWPLSLEPLRNKFANAFGSFRPTGRMWSRLSVGLRLP